LLEVLFARKKKTPRRARGPWRSRAVVAALAPYVMDTSNRAFALGLNGESNTDAFSRNGVWPVNPAGRLE
jgi:hypothetical protein